MFVDNIIPVPRISLNYINQILSNGFFFMRKLSNQFLFELNTTAWAFECKIRKNEFIENVRHFFPSYLTFCNVIEQNSKNVTFLQVTNIMHTHIPMVAFFSFKSMSKTAHYIMLLKNQHPL